MQVSIERYLQVKNKTQLEDFELQVLGIKESSVDLGYILSVKELKALYTTALANANKDFRYMKTAQAIEALTGDDNSFKRIRAMVGSPTKKKWGMSRMNLSFEVSPDAKHLKKY